MGGEAISTEPSAAYFLGQGALWGQLDLELTLEVLASELLVLPDIGVDHPADLLGAEQDAQAPVVHPTVVGDRFQVFDALPMQLGDEHRRNAAEAKAPDREGHAIGDAGDGLGGCGDDFVHVRNSTTTGGSSANVANRSRTFCHGEGIQKYMRVIRAIDLRSCVTSGRTVEFSYPLLRV